MNCANQYPRLRLRTLVRTACLIVAIASVAACTTFQEDHYFQEYFDEKDGEGTNFVRVRVNGYAAMSAARYVAGYYDERAVDLFFNEIKSAPSKPDSIAPIFVDNQKSPGTQDNIVPLSADQSGTFVMILSTNANAVADTIGNFAASNAVADALTNLLNKDELEAARNANANLFVRKAISSATRAELDALIARINQHRENNTPFDADLLRLINAIARSLGSTDDLTDIPTAKTWFAAREIGVGE